jgi:hypothetical protein
MLKEMIIISGNTSRKYKQYKMMQDRREYFGDISPKDEYGRPDLIPYSASRGTIFIASPKYDLGSIPAKTNRIKSQALK